ncbi:hypothetical protein EXIGLDRAFT_715836 [Exidia glandulosa HHB12029]|uniref:Uncharacterized protein n=1 Tax=Exidia glandulosa HHB12029 TaxID=1314781 RepID=A0A165QLI7_EXIGL|nr:hypothetical protein EXIGLDRAFT_715836 [Exidia glandulosa HHB12029]
MPPTFTFATDHAPAKADTARKVHIRRLYDLLELSVQRADWESARRAWSILCRCKDVEWKHLWRLGLLMISEDRGPYAPLDYLRAMMFQHPEQKQVILREVIHVMITQEDYRGALAELELLVFPHLFLVFASSYNR